ncbi:ENR1 protein, partial [Sakesphorus luctuosus]|nr:ENR1 protein [Sakesphorus luctuosus]
ELFKCKGRHIPPFSGIREVSKYWERFLDTSEGFWRARGGLFWICGKSAYIDLPGRWSGSYTLGIIQPGFFLLPLAKGTKLGVPL